METVKEKIAYLRGMIDGGEAIKDSTTRLVMQRMMEVLDDLADNVDELLLGQEEMEEYMEAIDADLTELEDQPCGCDHDHEFDEDELDMVEMVCPTCNESVCFEDEFLYDDDVEVTCPDCGEVVYNGEELDEDDLDDDLIDLAENQEDQ